MKNPIRSRLPTLRQRGALVLMLALLSLHAPQAWPQTPAAEAAYNEGLALQKDRRTEAAIEAYRRALKLDPDYALAHYEIGWSYWVLAKWDKVVHHWQRARALKVNRPDLPRYLAEARRNKKGASEGIVRAPIGAYAESAATPGRRLSLELVARFQHYNDAPANPADHFDPFVFSPKSARFSRDGTKVYVNALEGLVTIVFDPRTLQRTGTISHRFRARHAALFSDQPRTPWLAFPATGGPKNPNHFNGKPVESTLSADGRYLWVPYYRRSYDRMSTLPSAVAIIDTKTDRIRRIMATGPIPKYVVGSPDGSLMAVIHWGDNTVGLIDTRGDTPAAYRHAALITVGYRVDLNKITSKDRDHGCGYCLRGAVFTADGSYLLVARMGGGGIAVIDVAARRYLGSIHGMRPTPRHLELNADGTRLYMSLSFAGYVAYYRTEDIIDAVKRRQKILKPLREGYTGSATRTIALSPDGRVVFAAVNRESRVVALDADTLKPLLHIAADSYPVGMAVSPDGTQLWITAQGRKRRGGNSVSVYRIRYK